MLRMWALLPLGRTLMVRFVGTAAATALAVGALVAVAALVEGHAPRREALVMVAPLAGLVGAAWTLGGWRAGREDVALAGLGVAPGWASGWLLVLAAPFLWAGAGAEAEAGGEANSASGWALALAPGEVRASSPDGSFHWSWPTAAATEVPSPLHVSPSALPAPTTRSTPPRPPSPWPTYLLRLACAALLIGWLTRRATPPGPATVIVGATIAFVGSQLLSRLIA